MTRKELSDKLGSVEKEVKEIKDCLSQEKAFTITDTDSSLHIDLDFKLGYTLKDLYRGFGGKVSLARRL